MSRAILTWLLADLVADDGLAGLGDLVAVVDGLDGLARGLWR